MFGQAVSPLLVFVEAISPISAVPIESEDLSTMAKLNGIQPVDATGLGLSQHETNHFQQLLERLRNPNGALLHSDPVVKRLPDDGKLTFDNQECIVTAFDDSVGWSLRAQSHMPHSS